MLPKSISSANQQMTACNLVSDEEAKENYHPTLLPVALQSILMAFTSLLWFMVHNITTH